MFHQRVAAAAMRRIKRYVALHLRVVEENVGNGARSPLRGPALQQKTNKQTNKKEAAGEILKSVTDVVTATLVNVNRREIAVSDTCRHSFFPFFSAGFVFFFFLFFFLVFAPRPFRLFVFTIVAVAVVDAR